MIANNVMNAMSAVPAIRGLTAMADGRVGGREIAARRQIWKS